MCIQPDIDKCVEEKCLYIPYLQWLGISIGFSILAAVLERTFMAPIGGGSMACNGCGYLPNRVGDG